MSALDAARLYGLEIDRHGRALCVFHDDHHPSMSFRGQLFRCFACGAHGSAIDLTMRIFGLGAYDAAKKLRADFSLRPPADGPRTEEDAAGLRRARHVREVRKAFGIWREETLLRLSAAIREGVMAGRSAADAPAFTEEQALALRYRETLEDWADTLESADTEKQMSIFTIRKEVESICGRILKNTPTPSKKA